MALVDVSFAHDPTTGGILCDVNGYPVVNNDPTANTYANLQARIADEVLGSPTASHIQNAIQDAISAFEREPYWFNDLRIYVGTTGSLSGLTTVVGKEFYSEADFPALSRMVEIKNLSLFAFGNRWLLRQRTTQELDDMSMSPVLTGMPDSFAIGGGSLRLYPVPNQIYSMVVEGTIRFAPLVAPTDYNVWTNRAERLIRMEAKRLLFLDITRDAEQAAMCLQEVGIERDRLTHETGRRKGNRRIRPRL